MGDLDRLLGQDTSWLYALLFSYAFVKTGPLPIAAAYAATLGWLDAGWAWAAVTAGAFFGDEVRFALGRRYGTAITARFPRWAPRIDVALAVLERHHVAILAVFRFAKGMRSPVSLGLGATSLGRGRFTLLNGLTAVLWSSTLSVIGLVAGAVVVPGDSLLVPIVGLGLMLTMVVVLGWVMRREMERRLLSGGATGAALTR